MIKAIFKPLFWAALVLFIAGGAALMNAGMNFGGTAAGNAVSGVFTFGSSFAKTLNNGDLGANLDGLNSGKN